MTMRLRVLHAVRPRALAATSLGRALSSSACVAEQRKPYPEYVPLNTFQHGLMAVGSAIMSLADTRRHDMVAVLSETTGGPFLRRLRDEMRKTPSGRRLLRERPRITEQSINVDELARMDRGTFGREYVEWLRSCRVTPDTRDPVRFIRDPELAYVMQRYRESHDFYHVLVGFSVSISAELVVKWFELANFGLPVAFLSSFFGPLRLNVEDRRRLWRTYGTWALRAGARAHCLIDVDWEREWATNIDDLRSRLRIEQPPKPWPEYRDELREIRRRRKQQQQA